MILMNCIGRAAVTLAGVVVMVAALYGPANAQQPQNNIRVELGGGVQSGDPEITFAGVSEDLDTGIGYAAGAGLWVDMVGFDYLSLGAQYTRLGGGDYKESGSATVLNTSFTGTIEISHTVDAFMANAALRKNDGTFHPYIGGGAGVAFTSSEVSLSGTLVVNGVTYAGAGSDDDSDVAFAWQAFGGLDIDVTDNVYVGLNARYVGTDANLFGADVSLRKFVGMGVVGFRF